MWLIICQSGTWVNTHEVHKVKRDYTALNVIITEPTIDKTIIVIVVGAWKMKEDKRFNDPFLILVTSPSVFNGFALYCKCTDQFLLATYIWEIKPQIMKFWLSEIDFYLKVSHKVFNDAQTIAHDSWTKLSLNANNYLPQSLIWKIINSQSKLKILTYTDKGKKLKWPNIDPWDLFPCVNS